MCSLTLLRGLVLSEGHATVSAMERIEIDPIEALDHEIAAMTAASARSLRRVAAMDRDGAWKGSGATCMSGWLAARYGVAAATAREWVRVARALMCLPLIAEAYESGRLSWDQLRPLTRFATPETDARWAAKA